MKMISLLPSEYKKLKKSARQREFLLAALGILCIVAVFSYGIIKIMSSIPGDKLRMLKSENENLISNIQSLEYLNEREQGIRKETDIAKKAVSTQPDWLMLYTAISSTLPEGVQLSSITADPEENRVLFSFQGSAVSGTVLSSWMDQMNELELFSGLNLLYARSDGENSDSVVFEVKAVADKLPPFEIFEEVAE
ncbi:MAG: hypothetical protein GX115_16190 [Ruminiclostridium sp.]|nr:hypothetical protein [Ruminiclostridium sp.]